MRSRVGIQVGIVMLKKSRRLRSEALCPGQSGRSARDRDRLRQEILENLGWKIHRIWSTDWFRNRDSKIKRLVRRIDELLQADPVYQKEKTKVSRVDTVRQRLITLHEAEIKVAFPETPAEQGLLRKSLLDEFIVKRPKTRADWFRVFRESVRTSVDSKQVGKYLDRVLQMIAECES
jgi:REase_MTES_1575